MATQSNLEIITRSLNDIQKNCKEILKNDIDETDDTEEKLEIQDIYKVIESDINCRINLQTLEHIIPQVSVTEEDYDIFIEYSKNIIEYLNNQSLPDGIEGAFNLVKEELYSSNTLSLEEIFTVISVLITAVALCLTKLSGDDLSVIVKMLDTLLGIKEKQLNLIMQMSKWRSEYIN